MGHLHPGQRSQSISSLAREGNIRMFGARLSVLRGKGRGAGSEYPDGEPVDQRTLPPSLSHACLVARMGGSIKRGLPPAPLPPLPLLQLALSYHLACTETPVAQQNPRI